MTALRVRARECLRGELEGEFVRGKAASMRGRVKLRL